MKFTQITKWSWSEIYCVQIESPQIHALQICKTFQGKLEIPPLKLWSNTSLVVLKIMYSHLPLNRVNKACERPIYP